MHMCVQIGLQGLEYVAFYFFVSFLFSSSNVCITDIRIRICIRTHVIKIGFSFLYTAYLYILYLFIYLFSSFTESFELFQKLFIHLASIFRYCAAYTIIQNVFLFKIVYRVDSRMVLSYIFQSKYNRHNKLENCEIDIRASKLNPFIRAYFLNLTFISTIIHAELTL